MDAVRVKSVDLQLARNKYCRPISCEILKRIWLKEEPHPFGLGRWKEVVSAQPYAQEDAIQRGAADRNEPGQALVIQEEEGNVLLG